MEINQICFTFGENDSFYFSSPVGWAWRNLPASLSRELLNDRYRYDRVQNVALGPQGRWYLSGNRRCNLAGKLSATHAWSDNLPPDLAAWLPHRDIKTLEVVFGPGEAYVAWDAHGLYYANLPTALDRALRNWEQSGGAAAIQPRVVALGYGDSYFYLSQQNRCCYDATGSSVSLDRQLDMYREAGTPALKRLSINPFEPGQWWFFNYDWDCGIETPHDWSQDTDRVVVAIQLRYKNPQAQSAAHSPAQSASHLPVPATYHLPVQAANQSPAQAAHNFPAQAAYQEVVTATSEEHGGKKPQESSLALSSSGHQAGHSHEWGGLSKATLKGTGIALKSVFAGVIEGTTEALVTNALGS